MSVVTDGRRPGTVRACLLAACALAMSAQAAMAQSVDYADFEQLFGEPVTTSATGKPQRASEVPANMDIITADDIRRSGADNIPDILRMVPGVDVRRYGFGSAEVSIRGYNRPSNPRLLVLLNGRQVYFDDYGRTEWNAIPVEIDEIRQIEVVKGPNSALYGFNAASGVVNIITFDPMRERVNAVTLRGGTQEFGAASAVGTAQFGERGGVRVSAGGFRAREYAPYRIDQISLTSRENPRRGSISVDGRMRIAPGIEGSLSGSVVDNRSYGQVGLPIYATTHSRATAVRATLRADTSLGQFDLNVYRNGADVDYRGGVTQLGLRNDVTVVQGTYLAKLGANHTVRLGLEFRDNTELVAAERSRVGYHLFAANAMWDWQVLPSLTVVNAIRVDRLDLNYSGVLIRPDLGRSQADYDKRHITDVSFNSGITWRATEDDTFRLTLSRGLQAPSLFALGFQKVVETGPFSPPLATIGSPNLVPSSVTHAELGYDRQLRFLSSTVRTAVFAERTDNVLTDPFSAIPTFTRQGIVDQSANAGHSTAIGGEIGIRGAANGFRWNASYAYVSIADQIGSAGPQQWLDFQHGTPTHVVQLGGGYTQGRWEADVQGRWQSRYRDYASGGPLQFIPVEVPNYLQLNGRIAYKVTDGFTLALTGTQFNVSRLMQTAGTPVERRLFLTGTLRF